MLQGKGCWRLRSWFWNVLHSVFFNVWRSYVPHLRSKHRAKLIYGQHYFFMLLNINFTPRENIFSTWVEPEWLFACFYCESLTHDFCQSVVGFIQGIKITKSKRVGSCKPLSLLKQNKQASKQQTESRKFSVDWMDRWVDELRRVANGYESTF